MRIIPCTRAPLTGALLFFWALAAAAAPVPATQTARVRAVLDGDTVVLADGRHVRLIGVNAPELGHGEGPDEPLAARAKQYVQALVKGQTVRLELGPERLDHYGRTLARVVLLNGTDLQSQLLLQGLAVAVAVPPDISHLSDDLADEAVARAKGVGVWGNPYFRPRSAATLSDADTGFRFVTGRVRHIAASRKYIYLDLTAAFSLRVPRDDWAKYWQGKPADWLGAEVTARGWVARHGRWLDLELYHPAMLERAP